MLRVGLTGGVASGKSTIADFFADLGVPVIDTDEIARVVVEPGQPALGEISAAFGPEVLDPAGHLNRHELRTRIFADPAQRHRLEAILHPRIRAETLARSAAADGPYQILVVPLLLETGFDALVDRILVVDCPEPLQRHRLEARDNNDPALAMQMIEAQIDRSRRLEAADDVIDNSGPLTDTRDRVEALHQQYLALASVAE
jgi:dephospho-CoA kinase